MARRRPAVDAPRALPPAGTDVFQLTAPLPEDDPDRDDPAEVDLQALIDQVTAGITVTGVDWTSRYRANMRMAERYRVGNVFLAGDAAHVHSPASRSAARRCWTATRPSGCRLGCAAATAGLGVIRDYPAALGLK